MRRHGASLSRQPRPGIGSAAFAVLPIWLAAMLAPPALLTQAPSSPSFEVASIKLQTGPRPARAASSPDRFTDHDTTLRGLIEYAYELPSPQVAGGPEWMGSTRFAIDAKASGTPSRQEMRLLVRALLADRFELKTHTEMRELPVYLLERSRADGALGAGIRPTPTAECAAPVVSLSAPAGPDAAPPCGVLRATPVRILARGVAMSQLARNLHALGGMTGVDRIVLDRTGLTGSYTFEIDYRPAETAQLTGGTENPGIFDAFREQLGLKLTPTRAPVTVLVVDSAMLPAAD